MEQLSLEFEDKAKEAKLIFYPKDFIFNNGIVNLVSFLEESNFDVKYKLNEYSLEINLNDKQFYDIFIYFLKKNKIISTGSKKDKLYFNESIKDFELKNNYFIEGASSGNDIKNSYIMKTPEELGFAKEELQEKYLNFCLRNNLLPNLKEIKVGNKKEKAIDLIKKELNISNKKLNNDDINKIIEYLFEHKKYLTVPDGNNKVTVYVKIDDLIKNAIDNYFIKENPLTLDSKINPFETKIKTLFDMLVSQPKHHKIDKFEALIYLFGARSYRYFYKNTKKKIEYILLPNSSNLKSLYFIKKDLKMVNNSIEFRNKNGKIINTNTNIDFYNQLSIDEIKNKQFYISNSLEELELKFFMFLFSKIYHIEKEYKDMQDDELASLFDSDTFDYSKILFEAMRNINFVTYSFDKNFKYSLNEYTKTYKLLMFFLKLKENDLFSYFAQLLSQISISKKRQQFEQKEEYNQHIIKFANAILNFQDIINILYKVSYDILKTDEDNKKNGLYKRLGAKLFNFLNLYSKNIKGEVNMNIHQKSKEVGEQIGNFVAYTKDKDLLFKLRNVKNFKQMVSFLKDAEFAFLKEDKNYFLNTKPILEILDKENEEWELVRDYIAIYAIEQYKAKTYKEGE